MARAGGENFPVASRLLPRRVRAHLLAIYGFARLVDELGDAAPGDRLAALQELEADLDRAFQGRAEHPLLVRLQATLRECALPREPFARLIEANRADQRVHQYETWEQLRGYCALSDSICTALQLVEHCQDVSEDYAAGRVYVPAEDLRRFGCSPELLAGAVSDPAAPVPPPVRAVLAFELQRARGLLAAGRPLVGQLRGRPRVAVAAFLAGGAAALEAIERAGCDVRSGPPRPARARRALALARVLLNREDGAR